MPEDVPISADPPLARAGMALDGLSMGDCFGGAFFGVQGGRTWVEQRALPAAPWHYTDDTLMALSIYETLRLHGRVEQQPLAESFTAHYDMYRGYGPAMHRVLRAIGEGQPWRRVAGDLFEGQGSYGNGAAMRVAPIGGYFADDLSAAAEQAARSAEITHAHAEGIAGSIAVAVAAAWAWRLRSVTPPPDRAAFIDLVLPHVPESDVCWRLRRARDLPAGTSLAHAVALLGNGSKISAQDTVPFCLWCAGESLASYEEALWLGVGGLGDIDTVGAIVGGIVVLYAGAESIPGEWRRSREPLPAWPFAG